MATEFLIYQTEDGLTKIDVQMENETIRLTLDQLAELFQSDKPTISKDRITSDDIVIAKNYLSEKELKTLNRIVSTFFDVAELRAKSPHPMYMKGWVKELDDFANRYGQGILPNTGKVSHKQAIQKANAEFKTIKN
ncbi:RhuM family protein [Streptococcus halichoeri]|uniref:RhuM family protein n=1 Tax=Streptococcus halichoeri TaxID=254785 RepID=UPI0013596284|nr:RhuM family protein [Streptococcus halichoeri]